MQADKDEDHSNTIQNTMVITCKEEMVKIKSNSPQKSMWMKVNIKSNTVQNTMVITCMQKKVEIKSNTIYRTQW